MCPNCEWYSKITAIKNQANQGNKCMKVRYVFSNLSFASINWFVFLTLGSKLFLLRSSLYSIILTRSFLSCNISTSCSGNSASASFSIFFMFQILMRLIVLIETIILNWLSFPHNFFLFSRICHYLLLYDSGEVDVSNISFVSSKSKIRFTSRSVISSFAVMICDLSLMVFWMCESGISLTSELVNL